MSATRSTIAALEFAVAAVGIAITVSRHPLVRAGIRAAPHLMTPRMKAAAAERVREAAFSAGVIARRIVPRQFID